MADNALMLTTIAVDVATGVAQLKKFEDAVIGLSKKVDASVQKMDDLGRSRKGKETLDDQAKSATGLTAVLGKLGLTWGSVIGIGSVAAGASAVKSFFESSIKAAVEAETATEELSSALRAQGADVDAALPHLLRYATALSQVSVQSDEAVQGVQKTLIAIGGLSGERLDAATKATLDLSKGMGVSMETAARMMAKAAEGVITPFTRYGLVVSQAADETQKLQAVLDFVQKKFGGMAAGELNTVHGSLARLKDDWGELKESMGGSILKAADATSIFRELSGVMQSLNTQINNPQAMGFWKSIGLLIGGAAAGSLSFAQASRAVALDAALANQAIKDQVPALNSAEEAAKKLAETRTQVLGNVDASVVSIKRAKEEVEILTLALQGPDNKTTFDTVTGKIDALQAKIQGIEAATAESVGAAQRAIDNAAAGIGPKYTSDAMDELKASIGTMRAGAEKDIGAAKVEIASLQASLERLDPAHVRAVTSRIAELRAQIREAAGEGAAAFKGDLLQAEVKQAEPGSKDATAAQLASFDFVAAEKLRKAKESGEATANLEAAQAIERQAIVDKAHQAELDKEAGFQQRLLDARAAAAPAGSDEQLRAQLEAFDFRAAAEVEREAKTQADVTALVQAGAAQREQIEKSSADAKLATQQGYQERLLQLEVSKKGKGAEADLEASLALYDFKAEAEYDRAEKSGRDLTALSEAIIEGRTQLEQDGLDKIFAKQASYEQDLTDLRLSAAQDREAALNAQAEESWGVYASGTLGAFLEILNSMTRYQQINGEERLAALQESNAAELASFDQKSATELELFKGTEKEKQNFQDVTAAKRLRLEQNLTARVIEFSKMTQRQKLSEASAITGAVGAMVSSVFGKTKAGQYAATIINTASAVMNAMASLPYPANIVAAVATGVMGAVQLAKIQSTTVEGGGGSGGVSAPSVPAISYSTQTPAGSRDVTGTGAVLAGARSDEVAGPGARAPVVINVQLHALDEKDVRAYLTSPEIRKHVVEAWSLEAARS